MQALPQEQPSTSPAPSTLPVHQHADAPASDHPDLERTIAEFNTKLHRARLKALDTIHDLMDPALPPRAAQPAGDTPEAATAAHAQSHILLLRERAQRLRAAHTALRTSPLTLETDDTPAPAPKPARQPLQAAPRARRADAADRRPSPAEPKAGADTTEQDTTEQAATRDQPSASPAAHQPSNTAAASQPSNPPAAEPPATYPTRPPAPPGIPELRGHAVAMLRARWQPTTERAIRETARSILDYQRAFGPEATRELLDQYPAAPPTPT